METAIGRNLTLKGEYRYSDYGSVDILQAFGGPAGLLDIDSSTHTFHLGLNYRFNGDSGNAVAFETPAYDWNGLTVGGALGAGAVVHEINVPPLAGLSFNGLGGEGIFGEASLGYDRTFGSFVAGVSVDARYSGIKSTLDVPGAPLSAEASADYGFDVVGRVGMLVNQSTLAYALGGYSWQHFDVDSSFGPIVDFGKSGFTVGAGVEAALSERLTANIEYRYADYSSEDLSPLLGAPAGSIGIDPSTHTVRAGVKYKLF